jgi:hypothetical protein
MLLCGAFLLCAIGCGNDGCDDKLLAVTCLYADAGTCVDFTNLSTHDQSSSQRQCLIRGGLFDAGVCPAAARLGTCSIPPSTPNDDISCSPKGVVDVRYYASPKFPDADAAVSACSAIRDAGFTPN